MSTDGSGDREPPADADRAADDAIPASDSDPEPDGNSAADEDPIAGGEPESDGGVSDAGPGRTVTTRAPGDDVVHPAEVEREFGWRGYVLLGVLFLALVVAPLVVYFRPPALPWYVSLVIFPLLPALLLGAVGVWATTRP